METEGYATNMLSYFYLDPQYVTNITNPILLLFSGILFNFEKPFVGMELNIRGTNYIITRINPPENPGNPSVNNYYVDYLRKDRTTIDKNLPHNQWEFTEC